MVTCRLSRYAHLFHKHNDTILYHSLLMESEVVPADTVIHDDHTIHLNDAARAEHLLQKGFLIHTAEDDDRLLRNYRQEIKEPYISTAYFFITKNCNLACRYCFEKQSEVSNSNEGIMSAETAEKGIGFFSRLIRLDPARFNEKKTIIFYGGEPFHNKTVLFHAIDTVNRYIAEGKLPASTRMLIVTNGTLLHDDDIEFIRQNNITLTFSLDGDREASVNRVFPDMKTLAWEKATETYQKCKAAGIDLNVACTLTPQTISRRREVLDYFIHTIQAANIGFNVILDNDIIQLNTDYDEAAAEFVTSSFKVLDEKEITENRTRRRLQVFDKRRPCLFDCNATGGRQIAIAPDGEVGICHEHIMDKKHFITTIDNLRFDPRNSPIYLEWQKRSPLYMKECYDCPALGICGGGCVINTERKYGTMHRPDPRFCKQTLAILEKILLPGNM